MKSYVLAFSHICSCLKKGQDQPKVINFNNLGSTHLHTPMLHTKFQSHWSFGSGEEEFLDVFTICGHDGHLGSVTLTICIFFLFLCSH